jgi:hypothetical protein
MDIKHYREFRACKAQQAVEPLNCSQLLLCNHRPRIGERMKFYQGAADRGEYRQAAGVAEPLN